MTNARDLMSNKLITVESTVSPWEAAKIMNKNNVSCIVITKDQNPIGIITERDFVSKIVAQNKKPIETKISDVASTPLVAVSPFSTADEVAEKMLERKIRQIVVMELDQPLGIITVTDFVKHLHSLLSDTKNYKQEVYEELIGDWEYWNP